jgi:prepilin-type N-terminal cleavage/methylation domain-containing protein
MRARRGFTLLEVMAAVAILGLVYAVLARAATQGVVAEGASRRRMQAALLADARLADLETRLATGEILPDGTREEELDEFRIAVGVEPFVVPEELLDLVGPPADSGAQSLLGDVNGRQPSALRVLHVTVAWSEGLIERQVERITLVPDLAALEALVPPAAPPEPPTPPGDAP